MVRKDFASIQAIPFDFFLPVDYSGSVELVSKSNKTLIAELSCFLVNIGNSLLWYINYFNVLENYRSKKIGTNLFNISIYEMLKIKYVPIFTFLPVNTSLHINDQVNVMNKVAIFLKKFDFIEDRFNHYKLIKYV
jgi:hypothetical protein